MTSVFNITALLFASLSILASLHLLFIGVKKPSNFDFSTGFLFLLGSLVLGSSLSLGVRIGHWNMYTWLLPLGVINIVRCSKLLKLHKAYHLSIILMMSLLGFYNYFYMFQGEGPKKLITAKVEYLVKNNQVLNIILCPANPIYRELSIYYGRTHRGHNTLVLDSPTDPRELGKIFNVHKVFNGVNFIFVENDNVEKESSIKIKDILLAHYQESQRRFEKVALKNHPFLKGEKVILEIVNFKKR